MTDTGQRPALNSIHHTALRCRDAEQTRWFYEDVLGLTSAAAVVLDVVPGTGADNPYMHIFFELGNGDYIAFFDAPGDAEPVDFERKDSFDLHIAFEVGSEDEMLAMQSRIKAAGVGCAGPIEHEFVRSVYFFDPNGIPLEVTYRTAQHDAIMAEDKRKLPEMLTAWTQRTREQKIAKFGADTLDARGKPARAG